MRGSAALRQGNHLGGRGAGAGTPQVTQHSHRSQYCASWPGVLAAGPVRTPASHTDLLDWVLDWVAGSTAPPRPARPCRLYWPAEPR